MRDDTEKCCHALYWAVSTAAWGFQMLNEESLMLKKDDDLCKTTFTSYKPSSEKYSGLFLCADTKIHLVLNSSD